MPRRGIVLALTGDVMTGRGVDQILPGAGDPRLWEDYVDNAEVYVSLAERASGPVPRAVDPTWPWGGALAALDEAAPDVRIINLETSVTTSDEHAPGKPVCYRMHPDNIGCVAAARPDVCALANNHVLDFGVRGLAETLDTLSAAGLTCAGAGRDAEGAWRPAVVEADGVRVLVWSVGSETSGVPSSWAAGASRPGVAFLPDLSDETSDELVRRVAGVRRPEDVVVVSVHWGSNWGHGVPRSQIRFARQLVDGGVDLVHGHSSHHPRPVAVHRDRLVLHGCGDFIDDYEGITGHEQFRPDLRLLYLATLDPETHRLVDLEMVPLQARRMRLEHAGPDDARWLARTLDRSSRRLGTRVEVGSRNRLRLR